MKWKRYNNQKLKKGDLVKVLDSASGLVRIASFTERGFIEIKGGKKITPIHQHHIKKGKFKSNINIVEILKIDKLKL